MAEPVPAGSDVSAGTYRCTECGNELQVGSTKHLPPCPSCGNGEWHTVSAAAAQTILSKPRQATTRLEGIVEFDKQTVLDEIQKRGGDHQKAAEELPDKVDHEQHSDLLKKFGVDPDDIMKSAGGRLGL